MVIFVSLKMRLLYYSKLSDFLSNSWSFNMIAFGMVLATSRGQKEGETMKTTTKSPWIIDIKNARTQRVEGQIRRDATDKLDAIAIARREFPEAGFGARKAA